MTTNNAVDTTLSGQTGTGNFVGSISPSLTTPALGYTDGWYFNQLYRSSFNHGCDRKSSRD